MSTTEQAPSTAVSERDTEKGVVENGNGAPSTQDQSDASDQQPDKLATVEWDEDPRNPMNWPGWKKVHLIMMLASFGFVSYVATLLCSSRIVLADCWSRRRT